MNMKPESPAVEYFAGRLTFKRDVIESLSDSERFRVVTPAGVFQMTKAEFHSAFPGVIKSASYRDKGIYHYPRSPKAAEPFRIA